MPKNDFKTGHNGYFIHIGLTKSQEMIQGIDSLSGFESPTLLKKPKELLCVSSKFD